jgi:hypothetical protein
MVALNTPILILKVFFKTNLCCFFYHFSGVTCILGAQCNFIQPMSCGRYWPELAVLKIDQR